MVIKTAQYWHTNSHIIKQGRERRHKPLHIWSNNFQQECQTTQ